MTLPSAISFSASPQDIRRILHPRSVAIIGASEDEGKWGGRIMRYFKQHRFAGEIYPINPKADKLFGWQAYSSLTDCPGPVDMAVLLLPKDRSGTALAEAAAKGVHSVVAITAGYAEAGEQGRIEQDAMVADARKAGMRVIGPNCMGLINTHHHLAASTAMVLGAVEALPQGDIGIVSQSGAIMGVMLARGVDIGAGFSSTVSVGNQADLDVNDFFDYLIEDPETRVICLYIEEARDPQRFTQLLDKARLTGKPVLVLKAGRTSAGAKAVTSHTASLAGPYAIFEAACRARGAYLFETPLDMVYAALLIGRGKRLTGDAIAVFSGSGGGNALLVDQVEDAGLAVAQLSPASRELLIPHVGPINATLPLDLAGVSAHATQNSPMQEVIQTAMNDETVGAGIMLMTTQPNMDFVAQSVRAAGEQTDKPLIYVHAASNVGQSARDVLQSANFGYCEDPHQAIAILKALNDQRRYPAADRPTATQGAAQPDLVSGYQNEVHARLLLEAHGIETSEWRHAMTLDECLAAGRELAYPVALKGVSSVIVHKSDQGLVKLNLTSDADLRQAFSAIQQAVESAGAPFEGVIVTEMLKVDFELIAGVKVDPDYGPMLLVGSGGVLVEMLKDTQLAASPVNQAQARALVERLACLPVLQGYRGRQSVDMDALCTTLVRLSELAWNCRLSLVELEINPLAMSGGRLVALDARGLVRDDQ
ncbi:acyl-CoA synthetase [Comamonas testosteroni]|uniref:Acyl-CoA synthetase n=1 Tax=Comamonas testosteroni TaxID=285 RepID=A0A5A7MKP2_COMTE|nr:acetate--CoA ligase family protein [Comamonas testosteroni]GEQ77481.1 acyl-CoA synthetase [Comamonas testosteroni]